MGKSLKPISGKETADKRFRSLIDQLPSNDIAPGVDKNEEPKDVQGSASVASDIEKPQSTAEPSKPPSEPAEMEISPKEQGQPTETESKSENHTAATEPDTPDTTKKEELKKSPPLEERVDLFVFERLGNQFAVPIKHVVEVIRDFSEINPLSVYIKACLGTIVYRNRLLPVFESRSFGDMEASIKTSDETDAGPKFALVKLSYENMEFCITMNKHIAVVAAQSELAELSGDARAERVGSHYIKDVVGYKNSNLTIISCKTLHKEVKALIGQQGVIDVSTKAAALAATNEKIQNSEFIKARIDDFLFVVSVHSVVEIIEGYEVTRIYGQGDFFRGLINLRGQVLACVDISGELGLSPRILDERNKFIVLEFNGAELVLCVDDVLGLSEVDPRVFQQSSAILGDQIAELFQGLAEINNETILCLSAEDLIGSNKLDAYKARPNQSEQM